MKPQEAVTFVYNASKKLDGVCELVSCRWRVRTRRLGGADKRKRREGKKKLILRNSEKYMHTFILFDYAVEEFLEIVPVLDIRRALSASRDIEDIVFR